MSVAQKHIEKYKSIAKKYGIILSDADIMYLQAYSRNIAKQEIMKTKEKYDKK